jgi:hypothetical protein
LTSGWAKLADGDKESVFSVRSLLSYLATGAVAVNLQAMMCIRKDREYTKHHEEQSVYIGHGGAKSSQNMRLVSQTVGSTQILTWVYRQTLPDAEFA